MNVRGDFYQNLSARIRALQSHIIIEHSKAVFWCSSVRPEDKSVLQCIVLDIRRPDSFVKSSLHNDIHCSKSLKEHFI